MQENLSRLKALNESLRIACGVQRETYVSTYEQALAKGCSPGEADEEARGAASAKGRSASDPLLEELHPLQKLLQKEFEGKLAALLVEFGAVLTASERRVGYSSEFSCEYLSEDEYFSGLPPQTED